MTTTQARQTVDLKDLPVTTLQGEHTTFGDIVGDRTALVVNVASRCGLSPQYEQLEALQKKYADRGFTVIGFPCRQFLGQELKSEKAIEEYCSTTWGVTFPMSARIKVNGSQTDPIYVQLKDFPPGGGRQGRPHHLELREVRGEPRRPCHPVQPHHQARRAPGHQRHRKDAELTP